VNVVPASHKWEFQARFRRHAFGWRSRPAILRIKQAVTEIKKAVRRDPLLAADGAVLLFDFGAQVDGYRSDMTRTLFVGEGRLHPGPVVEYRVHRVL